VSGRAAGVLALAFAVTAATARAQISPGPLSRAHAKLEGSSHCLECHDRGKGVAADKCFACHRPLQQRVAAGKGLHARPEYRDCKTCHVEHQGADAELVWWGKQGRAAFDHATTGHALAGKHAQLACDRCHKPPVYVGLTTACASCHVDEHRGQFAGRACSECHAQTAWKPAQGFDHAKTRWPLTGRHTAVGCEKCHTRLQPDAARPGASYRVFRAVAGQDCSSCHQDTHKGRLGSNCSSCHNTGGWRGALRAGFDHSRTGYPLTGRHANVACDRCHVPGQPMHAKHDRCTDCHRDPHPGPPARTAESGRCERCHDVNGFRPARFGLEDHAKTGYPLAGAHLAIACDACHRPLAAARPAAAPALHFSSTRCADCHRDPHRGEAARLVAKSGCEACHRVDAWRSVSFDHAQTRYPLAGSHERVACVACHRRKEPTGTAELRFAGLATSCGTCHNDPHRGQFARTGQTACERCHTTDTVKAAKFDHSRDAAYRLDGAHARLACSACHKPETQAGVRFVRYKPLATTCSGCHGPTKAPGDGGPR
jgi:hypothetical protein